MPGKGAILGFLHLRDADRKPDPGCGQTGGKNKSGEICQHPMAEFVLLICGAAMGRFGHLAGGRHLAAPLWDIPVRSKGYAG